jgi:PAB-dependent poly(A)-specific ribonuclease subunit 3
MTGFKLVNEQAFGALDTWRRIKHPNIVGIREAFTTKAFNDNCQSTRSDVTNLQR